MKSICSSSLISSQSAGGAPNVPIGEVSVMPQAWPTWIPRSRNQSIIARGAAEPPMVTYLQVAEVGAGALDMLDHAQPDGRHAGRMGDLLVAEQVAHLLRAVIGRQHQLAAGHRRRPRQAPGVGVEHRHDRQRHRARRQVEAVGRDLGQGVEHGRAMLVEHALGIAGRAAGVAQAARVALVALDPGDNRRPRPRSSRRNPLTVAGRSRYNARSSVHCGFIRSTSGAKARS